MHTQISIKAVLLLFTLCYVTVQVVLTVFLAVDMGYNFQQCFIKLAGLSIF